MHRTVIQAIKVVKQKVPWGRITWIASQQKKVRGHTFSWFFLVNDPYLPCFMWDTLQSKPGPEPGPLQKADPRPLEKADPIPKFTV